jgi:hypothetical protein
MSSIVAPLDMSKLGQDGIIIHGNTLGTSTCVIYTDDVKGDDDDVVVIIKEDKEAGWEFVACAASVPSEPSAPSAPSALAALFGALVRLTN